MRYTTFFDRVQQAGEKRFPKKGNGIRQYDPFATEGGAKVQHLVTGLACGGDFHLEAKEAPQSKSSKVGRNLKDQEARLLEELKIVREKLDQLDRPKKSFPETEVLSHFWERSYGVFARYLGKFSKFR